MYANQPSIQPTRSKSKQLFLCWENRENLFQAVCTLLEYFVSHEKASYRLYSKQRERGGAREGVSEKDIERERERKSDKKANLVEKSAWKDIFEELRKGC